MFFTTLRFFAAGALGPRNIGPMEYWAKVNWAQNIGPREYWAQGKLGPGKIGPKKIGPRKLGPGKIGP